MAFVMMSVTSVSDCPSIITRAAVHVTQEAQSDSDQTVSTSKNVQTRSILTQGDVVISYR